MARDFNGTTDKVAFGTGGGVGSAVAWSVTGWLLPTATASGCMISKRDSFTNGGCQFFFGTPGAGTRAWVIVRDMQVCISAEVCTSGVWNGMGCACDGAGAIGYINATPVTDSGAGGTSINGNWVSGTGTGQQVGVGLNITEASGGIEASLAEIAVWNAKLTAPELLSITSGAASPLEVRPNSLVHYIPLVGRASPEQDIVGGLNGTVTGTTTVSHPRVNKVRTYRLGWMKAPFVAPTGRVWKLAGYGGGLVGESRGLAG